MAWTKFKKSELVEAIEPFARFFKGEGHDLSPAQDHTIVASFMDKDNTPLADLSIEDFRRLSSVYERLTKTEEG